MNQIIYVTASSYAQQNPDVVKRFNAALSKAAIAANGDPHLAIDTAAKYLKLPPELLARVASGADRWAPNVDMTKPGFQ